MEAGREYRIRIEYRSPDHADDGITIRALRFGMEGPTDEKYIAEAAALAAGRDVAVLFVRRQGEQDSKGHDLPDMRLPGDQDALMEAVAAANPNVVVVLHTGGPIEMPWLEKVRAVVQVWYPGQEVGHAIADVLLGDAEPVGRLPQTFPKVLHDAPVWTGMVCPVRARMAMCGMMRGVFVGYRHPDGGVEPLFPFGFVLPYTRFDRGQPKVSADIATGLTLRLPVTNTGKRAGAEVVQPYVRRVAPVVARPEKELRAFAKLSLEPGQTGTAETTIELRDRDRASPHPST